MPDKNRVEQRFTEAQLKEHAQQLAALGMCCINQELWKGRHEIEKYIEQHFQPIAEHVPTPAPQDLGNYVCDDGEGLLL